VSTADYIEVAVALGTFSLALVTWRMAKATRDLATASNGQLALLRRQADEAIQPDLHAEVLFTGRKGGPMTIAMTIINAGGGLAKGVSVVLVAGDHYARVPAAAGLLRPGESVNFGSDLPAAENPRAVVYCRGQDGEKCCWNLDGERHGLGRDSTLPTYEEIFASFYPGTNFSAMNLGHLLRGGPLEG